MNTKKNGINTNTGENDDDQWAFQTWRTCDIIAQQRTDVAGEMRQRPSKPHISYSSTATIEHPDGRGVVSNTQSSR